MTILTIGSTVHNGSVMVVDDEAALRYPISEVLRDMGVTVIEAGTADEALQRLEEDSLIQVVFSDVRMPGRMDGIELAKTIEANFTGVTVILTSGNIPTQMDPYRHIIAKPYSLHLVSQQIIAELTRSTISSTRH